MQYNFYHANQGLDSEHYQKTLTYENQLNSNLELPADRPSDQGFKPQPVPARPRMLVQELDGVPVHGPYGLSHPTALIVTDGLLWPYNQRAAAENQSSRRFARFQNQDSYSDHAICHELSDILTWQNVTSRCVTPATACWLRARPKAKYPGRKAENIFRQSAFP